MSLYFAAGSPTTEFSPAEIRANLFAALDKLGPRKKVLTVPPDFTRMHSMSGILTEHAWNYYGAAPHGRAARAGDAQPHDRL